MTTPAERPLGDEEVELHRTGFGLALSIDPRLSIPGLGECEPIDEQRSRVRLDDGELQRRWRTLANDPLRARELRGGDTLLLSVDYDERAGYLMWALDHGRVLISPDGLELLCEADPVNEDWASIIAAQALPLAATVRGLEVMHASGVVLDGEALLFAGPPGAGKSSLAAALVSDGAQLLSDDAVALQLQGNGRPLLAHAGSGVLQLRSVEQRRLTEDGRARLGSPIRSFTGKHRYAAPSVPDAAPLAALFLLERSAERPAVEPLPAVNPFELIGSTFNLSVRTPARLQRQLDVASAIADGKLAHRLRVQPGVDATQLASLVRKHRGLQPTS
jgi:hypothetical protein